jgi:hypothetical protein
MTPENFPSECLVHATSFKAWEKIRWEGLIPGVRQEYRQGERRNDRQDVHFATVLPLNNTCRMSGLRENRPIWIFIKPFDLWKADVDPRITENRYVVTRHTVPTRIFDCVVNAVTMRDARNGWALPAAYVALITPSLSPPVPVDLIVSEQELALANAQLQTMGPSEVTEAELSSSLPSVQQGKKKDDSSDEELNENLNLFPDISMEDRAVLIEEEE